MKYIHKDNIKINIFEFEMMKNLVTTPCILNTEREIRNKIKYDFTYSIILGLMDGLSV